MWKGWRRVTRVESVYTQSRKTSWMEENGEREMHIYIYFYMYIYR